VADSNQGELRSKVRWPRGKVTVNGKPLRFVQIEVIQNAHHEADSYDVQAPLFDPDQTEMDWKFWASQADIEVEISIGFAPDENSQVSNWTRLIVGPVDAVSMSPVAYGPHSTVAQRGRTEIGRGGMLPNESSPAHPFGAMLQIRGRDYSGQLIDSEVSSEMVSGKLTSKQVLQNVVGNIPQLSLDAEAMEDDSVGDPVNDAEGRLTLHRSAWDVITGVAEHEGMRVTMQGRTVKVAPANTSGPAFAIFYTQAKAGTSQAEFQQARSNCMTLRLARALSVGKGVDNFVQSYDSRTGRRPSRAVGKARSSGNSGGSGLIYTENQPGMTKDQVKKHAHAKAGKVAKYERDIEFQIPGDTALTVDTPVQLSGTGTAFDLTYEVNQLTHFYDLTQGYRMECRARNKSSDVQVTVQEVTKGKEQPAAVQLAQVPDYKI
jgi:hypothetical protein